MEKKHKAEEPAVRHKSKRNSMLVLTWVLVVLFVASLAVNVLFFTGTIGGTKGLTQKQAQDKVLDVLNNKVLQNGVTATIDSTVLKDGLYEMKLTIQGQQLTALVTKDGKYFFPQVIPLDNVPAVVNNDQTTKTTTELSVGDAPVKGPADAKVTIIMFSDFSCPFCGGAAGTNQEVVDYLKKGNPNWIAPVPEIMKEYVDTGKVRIVFKYFPGHGTGMEAQKIGWCANEQGKFWELHDLFFANQPDIANVDKLKSLAESIGVDMTELDTCYKSGKYDDRLQQETAEGRAAGVSGTPSFFINGQQMVGAQSFTDVKKVIDAQLAK